jgi:leader peptidase (prepilin peptidase)/N-methyltransferase
MDVSLILMPLAQIGRPIVIQDPWISPDAFWWIGAGLFALWMFAVGSSVGSFLNVVVYRLPAGINLSSPGSRCPRCLSPIRLRHNIPVLGWLLLRGRCYDCQLPISSRYPLVEALIGSLFVLVGCAVVLGNGYHLPIPPPGSNRSLLSTDEPLVLGTTLAVQLALLTTLIGAALIDHDRQRIPPSLFVPVLLFAFVASLVFPAIHPLPAFWPFFTEWRGVFASGWQQGLLDVAAGAIGGIVVTAVIYASAWVRPWFGDRYAGPVALLWMSLGMVFGWQMLPWLLLAWAISLVVAGINERSIVDRAVLNLPGLVVAMLVTFLLWRWLARYPLLLEPGLAWQAMVMLLMLLASSLCIHFAARSWPNELPLPPAPLEIVSLAPVPVTDELGAEHPEPASEAATSTEPTPSPDLPPTP